MRRVHVSDGRQTHSDGASAGGQLRDDVQGQGTPGHLIIVNPEDLTADPNDAHSRHESFRWESKRRQRHLQLPDVPPFT